MGNCQSTFDFPHEPIWKQLIEDEVETWTYKNLVKNEGGNELEERKIEPLSELFIWLAESGDFKAVEDLIILSKLIAQSGLSKELIENNLLSLKTRVDGSKMYYYAKKVIETEIEKFMC